MWRVSRRGGTTANDKEEEKDRAKSIEGSIYCSGKDKGVFDAGMIPPGLYGVVGPGS
jgi:hypothetical protein